jgi:hypothetical protein
VSVSQSVSQNCYSEENQKAQKYQNKNSVPSRSSRTIFIQQKPGRTRARTNATVSKLMDITTILPPVYLLCKQPKNKTKPQNLEEFCTSKKHSLQKKEIPPSWQTKVLSKLLLFFEVKYSICIQLSQHAKDDNEEEEEEEENDDDDGSFLLVLAFPFVLPSPSSSAAAAASSLLL